MFVSVGDWDNRMSGEEGWRKFVWFVRDWDREGLVIVDGL